MAELQTQRSQVVVSGKGCFDFYKNGIITASEDEELKFYDYSSSDGSFKLVDGKETAIDDKITWLSSNGKDIIAYAKKNKVYTLFREKNRVLIKSLDSQSSVTRILYPNSDLIMMITDKQEIFLYWVNKEEHTTYKTFHSDRIVWADVDWTSSYIATIGADWTLNIWKLGKKKEEDQLLHSSKVLDSWDSSLEFMQARWSPDGKLFAIPGNNYLKVFKMTNKFDVESKTKISHRNKISMTLWINSNILVTVDVNGQANVWNFSTQTLSFTFNINNGLTHVKYCSSLKWLAFYSSDGYLDICNKDFESEKSLDIVENQENANNEEDKEDDDLNKNIEFVGDYDMELEKKEQLIDELVSTRPQPPLMPSSCLDPLDYNYKMLCWNSVGSVAINNQHNYRWIEVDFADKSFHQNLILEDDIHAELADLSRDGVLLASKAEEINLDEYEDETNKQKYISKIKFESFSSWNSIKKWRYSLPKGENAEVLTVGVKWCAVATDSYYIRVFSLEGVQTFITSITCSIVSLVGYENLLWIVSHNGVPFGEWQNLKMKIVDTDRNFEKIVETEVPLSPFSKLKWIGYSEEGELYIFDSDGILKAFSISMGYNWIPVLDVSATYDIDASQFWIVEIVNGSVAWTIIRDKLYPDVSDKRNIRLFKMSIPFLGTNTSSSTNKNDSAAKNEEEYLRDFINLSHQQWRKKQWSHLKGSRTQTDPNFFNSSSIWENEEILEKQRQLDKTSLNSIRIAAIAGDKAKVIMLAKRFNFVKYFNLAIEMLEKLELKQYVECLKKLLAQKEESDLIKNEENEPSLKQIESKPWNSIADKIARTRASIENELTNKIVAKKTSVTEEPNKVEPLNEVVANNPFAKKENSNIMNKKKNVFDDLMTKVTDKKKPVITQNPFAKNGDKKKLK